MRNIFKGIFVVLITALFIMRPVSSHADWQQDHNSNGQSHNSGPSHGGAQGNNGGQSHDNGHGHDGGHDHDRSYIGVGFSVWPDSYYDNAPYYPTADDVLAAPPVYQAVMINGTTYYLNDGQYYIYNGYSYQPVAPPVTVIQPPVVEAQAEDTSDSFTINIPNNKGGYTAVTLKKSGNGYIGPQGEFYPSFPTVYQLNIIYGK